MNATPKQIKLLRFIVAYEAEHGIVPSYDEMMVAMGRASKGNIGRMLDCLQERGILRRQRDKPRSIEVLCKPRFAPSTVIDAETLSDLDTPALVGMQALIAAELSARQSIEPIGRAG